MRRAEMLLLKSLAETLMADRTTATTTCRRPCGWRT